MATHFQYGKKEIEHLRKVDKRLAVFYRPSWHDREDGQSRPFFALIHLRIDREFPTIQTINLT